MTKKKIKSLCKERFGIKIPRNTQEALILNKDNGNTLWAEAIAKERTVLKHYSVFVFYPSSTKILSDYQWAPLQWVFYVKKEDMRRKA